MVSDEAEVEAVAPGVSAASVFVELIDTLVDDFDVIEMLTILTTRCVQLLEVAAAGILLADRDATLRVIGASNEQAHLLELMQVQNDEGPCLDCYQTGQVVSAADLTAGSPWPRFARASAAHGYPAVCAIPMRLKGSTLGCLNLFISSPVQLPSAEIALAQSLADVASIAILQDQTLREATVREDHLQHALESRVVIEQAKGMVAAQHGVDMDTAFTRLRARARNTNQRLSDVARGVIEGSVTIDSGSSKQRRPPPGRSRG